jgi:probable HAF family extracellular repeat protein
VAIRLNGSGAAALWTKSGVITMHAALWADHRLKDLGGGPRGFTTSVAHGINDRGEIAGWVTTSQNAVDSRATVRAFVWSKGRFKVLATLGGASCRALGIGRDGTVVGVSAVKNGLQHGFTCDGKSMTDLGTLPSGEYSIAFAINDAGHVVGAASIDASTKHATEWTAGKIADLGTLPGGFNSSARAINDHDKIVGFSETPDGYHAFLWDKGKMTDIGTLGADPSEASGINDLDEVVGGSSINSTQRHAFMWRDGKMTDLNLLIPDAYDVNNKGEIVCMGRRPNQPDHALLLEPLQTTP